MKPFFMELEKPRAESQELNRQIIELQSEYRLLKNKVYSYTERKQIRGKIRHLITRLEEIKNGINL